MRDFTTSRNELISDLIPVKRAEMYDCLT